MCGRTWRRRILKSRSSVFNQTESIRQALVLLPILFMGVFFTSASPLPSYPTSITSLSQTFSLSAAALPLAFTQPLIPLRAESANLFHTYTHTRAPTNKRTHTHTHTNIPLPHLMDCDTELVVSIPRRRLRKGNAKHGVAVDTVCR